MATVTWYATEREREVNSPTLRCLNQQVPRTDRIQVRMKAKATCTPLSIIGWTEKGTQVTLVAWPEEIEEEEKAKWLAKPFSAKMIPFHQRKFEKDSLVWGQKSADKDVGLQPKLRVPSHAKGIFSSRQTLAKEGHQVRQLRGCHTSVKERNPRSKPYQR